MAGMDILVFCSSQNTVIGPLLAFPPVLVGLGETILVSRVVIEDYSAFADAAEHADNVRW